MAGQAMARAEGRGSQRLHEGTQHPVPSLPAGTTPAQSSAAVFKDWIDAIEAFGNMSSAQQEFVLLSSGFVLQQRLGLVRAARSTAQGTFSRTQSHRAGTLQTGPCKNASAVLCHSRP